MVHVDVLEEGAVHVVSLLLDGGSELEKVLGHRLVGTSEDVDKAIECKSLVGA